MIVPTLETHAMLFGDTRYDKLPIAHINATYNNTKCTITDYTGKEKITHSSTGIVGYVNSKKKTAVAALAVGIDAGKVGLLLHYNLYTYVLAKISALIIWLCKAD